MSSRTGAERAHEQDVESEAEEQHAEEEDADAIGPTWQAAQSHAVAKEVGPKTAAKEGSARFENDAKVEDVQAGSVTYKNGDRGRAITKLQSALIDLGYLLPTHGVDGAFGPETETALKKFQHDASLPETGELDKASMDELHKRFDTRKPYLDNATNDPSHHGLRDLEGYEKKQALAAMVPRAGGAGATFQEDVGGNKYGDRIKARLTAEIASLHKDLFADKVGKRADPDKNFHKWSTLEGTAGAAKDVTDKVYGSYNTAPAMTNADDSLVDQWADEEARNAGLTPERKKDKADGKVRYLIDAQCSDINVEHNANTSGVDELKILDPIVASFVDTDAKVEKMLQIETGWEGAQLDGQVFVQRFKQDTDDANRVQLWNLFHTCIHEYMHKLRADKYDEFASNLGGAQEHTLIEGFCDFFTLNVRASIAINDALQQAVEGPYYKAGQAPPANSDGKSAGVYDSHQQAEQVVSIIGVRNAQAGYFLGEVERMGAP